MSDNDKVEPAGPSQGAKVRREAERRRVRQAAALRENLRRRKTQDRARDDANSAAKTQGTEPRS